MTVCGRCGAKVPVDAGFCGNCGAALEEGGHSRAARSRQPPPPHPAPTEDGLQWTIAIPLATDRFLLYDTGKVLGFTGLLLGTGGGIVALFLGGADAPLSEWLTAYSILATVLLGIGVGLVLVMLLLFRDRFPVRITIERSGVMWESLSRRSKWAGRTAILAGAFAGNPGVAGAGLLAEAQQAAGMNWSEVRRVNLYPHLCVISLMNSWRVVLRLHCYPALYDDACARIRHLAPHAQIRDRGPGGSR